MPKYKAIIEYNGTHFCGMQKQPDQISVQSSIEDALSKLFNSEIQINFGGRTDAGVHATGQVIDFYTEEIRTEEKVMLGLNFYLHNTGISCLNITIVNEDFHSRFSATQRHYVYRIINRKAPLTFQSTTHTHIDKELNTTIMQEAGNTFIGQHDFTSFRSSQCQGKSPIKTLSYFKVETIENEKKERHINIYFSAKSFLHNMVRYMTGALIEIGTGKKETNYIQELLSSPSQTKKPKVAPPQGLYLIKIDY